MSIRLLRREFIAGLGGAAAWPIAAWAQQGDRVRRIGVLSPGDENDPVAKTYLSAFTQALADLVWTDGRNVRIDLRQFGDDINRIRAFAREPNGALIVTPSALSIVHREPIVALAARHRLPAIYGLRAFISAPTKIHPHVAAIGPT